jgi:hypothetical protein
VTPGKDGSDRDAMTAARLGRISVPEVIEPPLAQPAVVARSRSAALALRFGLPAVAVTSAIVGWVLFGDTNPAIWVEGYWPVRELMPAAIAFSIGGAVLLGYRKARGPAGVLLICGLLAGLSLLFAGLWWASMMVHGPLAEPLGRACRMALDLLMGLSLTILPQLYPDGPLPGRLWKILLGVSGGLIVIATLANQYDFPTAYDLYEWYFWSTIIGLGWLIALASLIVRWGRGTALLRRQIVGFAAVMAIMIARALSLHRVRTTPLPRAHRDRRAVAAGRSSSACTSPYWPPSRARSSQCATAGWRWLWQSAPSWLPNHCEGGSRPDWNAGSSANAVIR